MRTTLTALTVAALMALTPGVALAQTGSLGSMSGSLGSLSGSGAPVEPAVDPQLAKIEAALVDAHTRAGNRRTAEADRIAREILQQALDGGLEFSEDTYSNGDPFESATAGRADGASAVHRFASSTVAGWLTRMETQPVHATGSFPYGVAVGKSGSNYYVAVFFPGA